MGLMRTTRYRLVPETARRADHLAGLAGAGRYVWNELLARHNIAYEAWKDAGEPEDDKPDSPTFFTLGKQFTALRNEPDHAWLKGYAFDVVRQSSAKRLADAFGKFFKEGAGYPRFHGRRGDDSFTIPKGRVRDSRLFIPKLGEWVLLRRGGGDPWASVGECRQVVVKRELGKWYAYVMWLVPEGAVGLEVSDDVVGVDMNAGQVATSDGDIWRKPETRRLESKWKRHQRRLARQRKGSGRRKVTKTRAAKARRAIRDVGINWRHQTSHRLAAEYGTVVVEELNVSGMTRKGGERKRGLNRVVRETGWRDLYEKMAYKGATVVRVDPRNTSRACHECGYVAKENRKSQALFRCGSCGYEGNADVNAALNIKALGVGASGRGGALALEATPMSRQNAYNKLRLVAA